MIVENRPIWVTIETSRIAIIQLQRCAEHLVKADQDPYRLLDATRCLHLSMVAALTEALTASAGTGALTPKSARRVHEVLTSGVGGVAFKEEAMSYRQLLETAQTPGRLEWVQSALVLSEVEQEAARSLDEYRVLVDHPKPTSWSVSKADVRRVLTTVAPIVRRLLDAVPQRYSAIDREVTDAAVAAIAFGGARAAATWDK